MQGDPIRIVPHSPQGIPDCGSFEVRFADGRPSRYFYWDDEPGRRSVTGKLTRMEALNQAKELARNERDALKAGR
jgi:hypothetical protein